MRFSHDLNYADREGCYLPRRVRPYESLGWDQAMHRGKKEKKSAWAQKKKSREVVLGGERVFSYLTPFFTFFAHCGAWSQANENFIPIFVNYSMCCTLRWSTTEWSIYLVLMCFEEIKKGTCVARHLRQNIYVGITNTVFLTELQPKLCRMSFAYSKPKSFYMEKTKRNVLVYPTDLQTQRRDYSRISQWWAHCLLWNSTKWDREKFTIIHLSHTWFISPFFQAHFIFGLVTW